MLGLVQAHELATNANPEILENVVAKNQSRFFTSRYKWAKAHFQFRNDSGRFHCHVLVENNTRYCKQLYRKSTSPSNMVEHLIGNKHRLALPLNLQLVSVGLLSSVLYIPPPWKSAPFPLNVQLVSMGGDR